MRISILFFVGIVFFSYLPEMEKPVEMDEPQEVPVIEPQKQEETCLALREGKVED